MPFARTRWERILAKKNFDVVVEIMSNTEDTDSQGQPTTTQAHKAWSRCKIDIYTPFANARISRPGGTDLEPLTNVEQLYAAFPLSEDDPTLIAETTESGDYLPGGIELLPTDSIIAFGVEHIVRAIRGPRSREIARHVDITQVGMPS